MVSQWTISLCMPVCLTARIHKLIAIFHTMRGRSKHDFDIHDIFQYKNSVRISRAWGVVTVHHCVAYTFHCVWSWVGYLG